MEQKQGGPDRQRPESVQLSFSGHPDSKTLRTDIFFEDPLNNACRNRVTVENLQFYFEYLISRDIHKVEYLFLVDIISSGGSLNGFYRVLKAFYQALDRPMPKLLFIPITNNLQRLTNFENPAFEFVDGNLVFKENQQLNIVSCSIPTFPVHMNSLVISYLLDSDKIQKQHVEGIEFPACMWTPDFADALERGGAHHVATYNQLSQELAKYFPPARPDQVVIKYSQPKPATADSQPKKKDKPSYLQGTIAAKKEGGNRKKGHKKDKRKSKK